MTTDSVSVSSPVWQKIVALSSCVLLASALLVAWAHPASGYELDIYSSTPAATWVFVCLAMVGGLCIIADQVVHPRRPSDRTWLWGLSVLVLALIAFLYLPYVRHYLTWGGDNLAHWGFIRDVVNTGHFDSQNFYPITHVILSQIVLVTRAPIGLVGNLSTPLLSLLFVVFTYLLSREVLKTREQQLVATAVAAVVLAEGGYHFLLMPNGWSLFFFPLVFYLFFRHQLSGLYAIPFIFLLVLFPYFHPLSSLMAGLAFMAVYAFRLTPRWHLDKRDITAAAWTRHLPLFYGVVELGLLISWLIRFDFFRINLELLWSRMLSGGGVLQQIANTLSKIDVSGLQLVILYLKLYGAQTILIILCILALALAFNRNKKSGEEFAPRSALDLGVIFLFFGLVYLLYLAGLLGLVSIAADRMLYFITIFASELAAVAVMWIVAKPKRWPLNYLLALVLLAVPSALSLRALYQSPYALQRNLQITERDMTGMQWFIADKDIRLVSLTVLTSPSNFFTAILGNAEAEARKHVDNSDVQLPDHLGYDKGLRLGENFPADAYAIVTEEDRITYSTVWKIVDRYRESDFAKLETDNTVSKLYSNGEMDLLYVRGVQQVGSP